MKQLIFGALLTAGLLAAGCAHNSIIASGMTRADRYYGTVGVTRHNNNITILRGSKVPKLSVLGNNNTITVESGVWLQRIEFWGKGNVVSLPEHLAVRVTEVGDNQIIRRPRELRDIPENVPMYPEATETTPTDTWDQPADTDYYDSGYETDYDMGVEPEYDDGQPEYEDLDPYDAEAGVAEPIEAEQP